MLVLCPDVQVKSNSRATDSRDEPSDPARRANWLPTPAGTFWPLLRVYEPDDAIFDGTSELPPITRVT